jgi:hypothetical protein
MTQTELKHNLKHLRNLIPNIAPNVPDPKSQTSPIVVLSLNPQDDIAHSQHDASEPQSSCGGERPQKHVSCRL